MSNLTAGDTARLEASVDIARQEQDMATRKAAHGIQMDVIEATHGA